MTNVTEEFNQNYLDFEDSPGMSEWGDTFLKKVPYFASTDSTTNVKTILYLPNTWLYTINTQGCNQDNLALFETFGDPGKGLWQFERVLKAAKESEMMVILTGDISVGDSRCNRQWSIRFNALVSAYQDVIRLIVFGGDKDSFNLFNMDLITGSWGIE